MKIASNIGCPGNRIQPVTHQHSHGHVDRKTVPRSGGDRLEDRAELWYATSIPQAANIRQCDLTYNQINGSDSGAIGYCQGIRQIAAKQAVSSDQVLVTQTSAIDLRFADLGLTGAASAGGRVSQPGGAGSGGIQRSSTRIRIPNSPVTSGSQIVHHRGVPACQLIAPKTGPNSR